MRLVSATSTVLSFALTIPRGTGGKESDSWLGSQESRFFKIDKGGSRQGLSPELPN